MVKVATENIRKERRRHSSIEETSQLRINKVDMLAGSSGGFSVKLRVNDLGQVGFTFYNQKLSSIKYRQSLS